MLNIIGGGSFQRVFLMIVIYTLLSCNHETVINTKLKNELELILESDQELRELCYQKISDDRKVQLCSKYEINFDTYLIDARHKLKLEDSLNLARVEEIIREYGYPGKSLVGETANESAWYVIQHSPKKIEQYFLVIKNAGLDDELSMTKVALSEDRMLMNKGLEQIYGSQASSNPVPVGTINSEITFFIWPIKDPTNVNERRKEVGFTTTIEEYARQLNIDYEVLTISDVD